MPSNPGEQSFVPISAELAERLLAHARLCRHIAEQTGSEETAQKLGNLASECVRAAAALATDEEKHPEASKRAHV